MSHQRETDRPAPSLHAGIALLAELLVEERVAHGDLLPLLVRSGSQRIDIEVDDLVVEPSPGIERAQSLRVDCVRLERGIREPLPNLVASAVSLGKSVTHDLVLLWRDVLRYTGTETSCNRLLTLLLIPLDLLQDRALYLMERSGLMAVSLPRQGLRLKLLRQSRCMPPACATHIFGSCFDGLVERLPVIQPEILESLAEVRRARAALLVSTGNTVNTYWHSAAVAFRAEAPP